MDSSPLRTRRLETPKAVLAMTVVMLLLVLLGLPGCQKSPGTGPDAPSASSKPAEPSVAATGLPRLLDLGAGKCIPCKMMAPILEQLKTEYAGSMEVLFIDVWQDPDAARKYGIQMIPTQIFFDHSGKELFRHEGFFAKEDILAKWKDLGIELRPTESAGEERHSG